MLIYSSLVNFYIFYFLLKEVGVGGGGLRWTNVSHSATEELRNWSGITCITISFIYGIPFVDLFDIFVLQALLKLTTGFLKREFQATPDFQNDDGVEFK